MTVEMFLTLLVFFSAATSLATEALKKLVGEAMAYNMLVLIVAAFVGIIGTGVYYLLTGIPLTINNIICMVLMGVANWIGAMVGYDKIKQLIGQLGA